MVLLRTATAEEQVEALMILLESELALIKEAADGDSEYLSLGGNGTNAFEVVSAFEPIVERARRIVEGGTA